MTPSPRRNSDRASRRASAPGHRSFVILGLLIPGLVSLGSPAAPADPAPPQVRYNRDIRPILAENCFPCHGPDSAARKADLRLDREAEATAPREEGPPIAKGDPAGSLVVRRIREADPAEIMPPPKSRKALKPAEKDLLERWIAQGAVYEPHWALIPPTRPPPSQVSGEAWVRNPIDRFILAGLEDAGLAPAPEADRRTLARRVSLDLTGLPPSPEDVEAFVNDPAPDAYEKLVDRFLGSVHWGEHRARYWLDAARYADTHGIHFDNYREMWTYREWVIRAFNRNLPFDRFTIEQLAGDLLPEPTLEQRIASGFNRCNITTNEGGAIDEEYLVLYARDRTETVSQVWLGLTAGCATCHDHKFDPLSQREFYELTAFFNNTTQAAMDGNIKDTPPVVPVPRSEDRERWDRLQAELARGRTRLDERRVAARPEFDRWLSSATPGTLTRVAPAMGLELHAPLAEGKGGTVAFQQSGAQGTVTAGKDLSWEAGHVAASALKTSAGSGVAFSGAGDFEKDRAFSFGAWVKLRKPNLSGAVMARMDDREGKGFPGWDLFVEGGRPGTHIIHRWPDDGLKVIGGETMDPARWHHLFITYDGSGKASGVEIYVNGARQEKTTHTDALKGSIRTGVPLKVGQRETGSTLDGVLVQDVRTYGRALPPEDVTALHRGTRDAWIVSKPSASRTPEELNEIYEGWLESHDPFYRDAAGGLAALEKERSAIARRGTVAHVMAERPEHPTAYILFRGEYDKRRDRVSADTPDLLPPIPADQPRSRLSLARWLLEPQHPLTARVTVNRFWQEVFGTAIVRTAGDFGIAGEAPSHPELLDWLAVEFRESGWDVKGFFKLLVTSAAYRQAAVTTPDKLQKDPMNRLISRGPRFRMDAEMVRDYALAASGLLVRKIGGPSVKPYQPDGVWEAVAMPGSDTRDYKRDSGENLYRRSLYTFWKRSAPPASMDVLNAPSRETCTVRRERTNTPLQALVTLNDPQFVEAARRLAELSLQDGGATAESRADFLARRLLARPLRPEEIDVIRESAADLLEHYRAHEEDARALISLGDSKADPSLDPAALAAYTLLTNQLMNLDEVLNK